MYTFYIAIVDPPAPVLDAIRKLMIALRLLLGDNKNIDFGEVNPEGNTEGSDGEKAGA